MDLSHRAALANNNKLGPPGTIATLSMTTAQTGSVSPPIQPSVHLQSDLPAQLLPSPGHLETSSAMRNFDSTTLCSPRYDKGYGATMMAPHNSDPKIARLAEPL